VTFQRLKDHAFDRLGRHAEEPLGGAPQRHVVAGDLHVGHGLDGHRHAFLRVGALDAERDRDDVQREIGHLLEDGDAQRGAAADDAEPDRRLVAFLIHERVLAPEEDGDGRRRHLDVVPREQRHRREEPEQAEQHGDRDEHR
jgi:hypothetical protein